MTIGLIGRKRGMTRIFTEDGHSIPVTVIEAGINRVARLISPEKDGYQAVQVAWGSKKPGKASKAIAGAYAKANIDLGEGLVEFRITGEEELPENGELKVDMFEAGQKVDVSGTSIGKGYSGVIKRHNFSHQRNSHGNSISHRAPGSIGQCQTPGRVFKGKKMAGHMGNVKRTTQNLEIVRVDSERNLLLIKGSVPGAKGGKVIIKPSVKARA
jgi:large subunit ribosomal protein L3